VLILLVAMFFLPRLRGLDRQTGKVNTFEWKHGFAGLGLLAMCSVFIVWSMEVPPVFGTVAVFSVALATLAWVFAEMQRFSEVAAPPLGLTMLYFRRVPVFILLGVWILIGSVLDDGSYHDVRTNGRAVPEPVGLRQLWNEWSATNCVNSAGRPVPLVIAVTEGGGIRAAYWTASVLTRLLPEGAATDCASATARSRIFAISGISGGSVGAVTYLARPSHEGNWFEHALGEPDFVATALARGMLVDLPHVLVGFHTDDRAAWLERAWETKVPDLARDYFSNLRPGLAAGRWTPLTLLNGAQVQTGCRVSTSAVQLTDNEDTTVDCRSLSTRDNTLELAGDPPLAVPAAPVTIDTISHLGGDCNTSIRSSTAALLSARWPYISPSGHLPCRPPVLSVVDGGYADGSGSAAAVDLWAQLQPLVAEHNNRIVAERDNRIGASGRLVVPTFVRIDNHYNSTATPKAPGPTSEPFAVPMAWRRAIETADTDRKQRAPALLTSGVPGAPRTTCQIPGQPVNGEFLLAPRTRPGVPAPLAWTLAGPSRKDLDDQRDDLFAPRRSDVVPAGAALRDLLTGNERISCTS
jgi:hypothetical protein